MAINRITGFSGAIDIDATVKKLMDAENIPLDKLKQQKQTLDWQTQQYRDMNSLMGDFRNLIVGGVGLQSTFNAKTVSSTNDSIVSAVSKGGSSNTVNTIDSITQLATSARWTSSTAIAKQDSTPIVATDKLSSFSFASGLNVNGPLTLNFNTIQPDGTKSATPIQIKIDGTTDSLNDVVTKINNSNLGVSAFYDNVTQKVVFTNKNTGAGAQIIANDSDTTNFLSNLGFASTAIWASATAITKSDKTPVVANDPLNSYSFASGNTVNGPLTLSFDTVQPNGTKSSSPIKIDIDGTDSLNSVIDKINSSDLGVKASYDSVSQKVVFTNKNTGSGAQIIANDSDTTNFLNNLGLGSTPSKTDPSQFVLNIGSVLNMDSVIKDGKETVGVDSNFTINGLTTSRKSNTFSLGDVTYTLKQTSPSPVTISTATDTQSVFDSVKAFVDKYNDLIQKMNDKINETHDRNYPPLTDAQKSAMKDADITAWQNQAQTGLLHNDSILSGVLNTMRSQLYSPVSGLSSAVNQLSQIGITTSTNYLDNGKLIIDENKLKQAITNDPTSVSNLFTANGATTGAPSSQQGLAIRLKNSLQSAIDSVALKAGKASYGPSMYSLGRNMTDLDTRISNLQDHLTQVENRYYTQFNAMDQAIQNANSQSASLAQYFK